jgi:ABC-type multidrug transport system fused ATPase/permease subunit
VLLLFFLKRCIIEKRLSLVVVANMVLRVLPMLICILYGGYLSVQGSLSAADFVTVLYLFGYIGSSSGRIPALTASLRMVTGSFEHLMSILNMPQEEEKEVVISDNSTEVLVEFEDVNFHYKEGTEVIRNLNFKLKKGMINAVVGFSGSGKSTLIKMICGFYEPVEGSVKLFGFDIRQLSPKYIRERIALVSQDTFLYPVTVAENIGYGKAGATLEEIIEASKAVHAHEFIIKLPHGYNTVLGEYGAGLSGGQKQRISLARAILKNAPVILMDEPTAALDSETEALFQETLEILRDEHAVLVISHRLSTIKNADCIFVMENGCIKDKGTHAELMKESSLYSQLYIDQSVMCQEEIQELKEVF